MVELRLRDKCTHYLTSLSFVIGRSIEHENSTERMFIFIQLHQDLAHKYEPESDIFKFNPDNKLGCILWFYKMSTE